jgi:hypothetical protein
MADFDAPPVKLLEFRRRIERQTPGGGEITREIYVEPYLSHPRVTKVLLGRVEGNDRIWPCNDPIYSHYFCAEVRQDQLAQEAIAFGDSTGLTETTDENQIASALYTVENACGAVTNKMQAGAVLTAIYRPLIFLSGLDGDLDRFDYVDPQLEPVSCANSVGRQMVAFTAKALGVANVQPLPDPLATTATLPEVRWSFTIRRMMVPRIPRQTIELLANKVNQAEWSIGYLTFPPECVRYDSTEVITKISPVGTLWYDLLHHFSIRTLVDEYYKLGVGYEVGPVGWNRMLCQPRFGGAIVGTILKNATSYYPVGWNQTSGVSAFGGYRHQYLYDADVALTFDKLFDIAAT